MQSIIELLKDLRFKTAVWFFNRNLLLRETLLDERLPLTEVFMMLMWKLGLAEFNFTKYKVVWKKPKFIKDANKK